MKSHQKVFLNGDVHYYNKNRQFHRTDGPAVIYPNGYKAWFINGQRHRTDGPAVEYSNGAKSWWLNDEALTEEEFKRLTSKLGKILYS
jgi:hypothetical protein